MTNKTFLIFGQCSSLNKLLLLLTLNIITLNITAQNADYQQLNAQEFNQLIQSNSGIVLDVRTINEFKNGHLKDAGQLNYYSFSFKDRLLLLPKGEPIYIYCNTGFRSQRAAKILSKNGYSNVYNLEHGIMEWNLSNLPIIIDPDAKPDKDHFMSLDRYSELINNDSLVLIDFYAPWCAPCRKMMPMIDSLKVEFQHEFKIVKINVDASSRLMKNLKLLSVPFIVMYKRGKLLFSHNGIISKEELLKQINQHQ